LDIPGGLYNTSDETIYANNPEFTLSALSQISDGMFFISAAIVPQQSEVQYPSFGNFTIGGQTYSAADMEWGTPPSPHVRGGVQLRGAGASPKPLPTHGIFPTYFLQLAFSFDPNVTVAAYNTAEGTSAPGTLFSHNFDVDVTGLDAGYGIHFDLYQLVDGRIVEFAPFSHDAQSGGTTIPDGGSSLVMLGLALIGVEGVRRSLFRK
jgi:hypothetical protein